MAGDWDIVSNEDATPVAAPTDVQAAPAATPAAQPQDWSVAATHPIAGPSGNWLTDTGRFLGTALVHAGVGAISPLLNQKGVLSVDPATGHVGLTDTPSPEVASDNAFNKLGATEYQPPTWLGRRGLDATTAAMAGVTGGPQAIIPSALGGATAGEANELWPGHPFLSAMLGFLPGFTAGRVLQNAPIRIAAAATNASPNGTYGAFTRLGLPTELAGTTTGDPGALQAEKFAARMPGSEGAVAGAHGRLVGAWQDALDRITSRIGTAATAQDAGTSLQGAAGNWLDQFKNQSAARWGLFNTLVPPTTQIPVSNFQGALTSVLHDFGGASNLAKELQPQLAQRLQSALGADLQGGNTLPWQAVQSVRSALGEMLENPQQIEGAGKAAVKRLYAGLSSDMENGANASGPAASAAFRQANTVTSMGHDILDSYVSPILNAETPEKAAQWALAQAKLGGTRVAGVTSNLPSAAGDLASYALRNAAGAGDGSPTSFGTALQGRKPIYSQEAVQALFPNAQDQSDVADLATTGRAMQRAEKDLADSPTATHATRGMSRLFLAAELAHQGHQIAGTPGAVAGGLTGFFAPNVMGRAAQVTALNPMLSALYGRSMPIETTPLITRAAIAQAIANNPHQLPFALSAPATSANSGPQ